MNRLGVLLAALAVALASVGCSGNDDTAEPASTTLTATSTTTTSTTITTTASEPAPSTTSAGAGPVSAVEWPTVELPFGVETDVRPSLVDPGTEPRQILRYGGTETTDWGIAISGTADVTPSTFLGTSTANRDGLVIEFATFEGEPVVVPIAVAVDPHGVPTVRTPTGELPPTVVHIAASVLIHTRLVPLPEEAVGVGARWSSPFPAPDPRFPAPEYELVDVDGTTVTVRAAGTADGFDLGYPGELRGSNAPSTGTFAGVLSFDLTTGLVTGEVTVTGTTQTNDGPIDFVRTIATEPASPIEPDE